MAFLKNRRLIWLAVVVVAAVAILFAIFHDSNSTPGSTTKHSNPPVASIKFDYPTGWQSQQLYADDINAGVLIRLTHNNPTASFFARTVKGTLAKDVDVTSLGSQIVDSLSKKGNDFALVNQKLIKIGNYRAVQINYKQTVSGNTDEYIMTVIPTATQTFYLTFKTKPADFNRIQEDIDKINTTFASYIAST